MFRVLMFVVPLVLTIYALVDCVQTDDSHVRHLQKRWWIALIVLIWVAGPVAWLLAGRDRSGAAGRPVPWRSTRTAGPEYERPRTLAPDDDPEFLAQMNRADQEHQQMLRKWEEDLRRREERMRDEPGEGDAGTRPE
ncbi:MAG: PLD nuclease N-terminal domain-containing protein [Actinomycetota bacterium]|nr:PLD nuclease N-terminal domain-containing protein [Actinomycetota bacterium]